MADEDRTETEPREMEPPWDALDAAAADAGLPVTRVPGRFDPLTGGSLDPQRIFADMRIVSRRIASSR